jgi:hypothetical protein
LNGQGTREWERKKGNTETRKRKKGNTETSEDTERCAPVKP